MEEPNSDLPPNHPAITAAVVKRIKAMPHEELKERLARRGEGVVERQFPDPTPTTRQELLGEQNATTE